MKRARTQQRDPVCGQPLESHERQPSMEYKQRRYFFCSERCRAAFEQRAERFRMNDLARAGALLTPGGVRWGSA